MREIEKILSRGLLVIRQHNPRQRSILTALWIDRIRWDSVHCEKPQTFRGWTEIGSGDFAGTFFESLDVTVIMECLPVFINPCSDQLNMFVADGAERVTCADGHVAPRGRTRMKSDGPVITLAQKDVESRLTSLSSLAKYLRLSIQYIGYFESASHTQK